MSSGESRKAVLGARYTGMNILSPSGSLKDSMKRRVAEEVCEDNRSIQSREVL